MFSHRKHIQWCPASTMLNDMVNCENDMVNSLKKSKGWLSQVFMTYHGNQHVTMKFLWIGVK